MPRAPRPGKRAVYLELDEAMAEAMVKVAEANGRTLKAEYVAAIKRYLANPDTFAPAEMPGPPNPKRGRKKG